MGDGRQHNNDNPERREPNRTTNPELSFQNQAGRQSDNQLDRKDRAPDWLPQDVVAGATAEADAANEVLKNAGLEIDTNGYPGALSSLEQARKVVSNPGVSAAFSQRREDEGRAVLAAGGNDLLLSFQEKVVADTKHMTGVVARLNKDLAASGME